MGCLFCKIVNKEIPSEPVVENEHVIVIPDINPRRSVHLLAIPKKHVPSYHDVTELPSEVQVALNAAITGAAEAKGIAETGYRVIFNVGQHGGQEILHLHAHILGGEPVGSLVS